ncbi:hypothetical protein [Chondromyces apiculatus]|uniref:Uncharacterized protein n=1 Tax=Chondromyces apiculatus DSM 436 TaxID=1192034 RepID=A0A017SX46_9BACT|nr:hypothetical protein [Chondromyces apiculatus]EYF00901.1 Hypothetical protein CAP_8918 [Chondromyces apiculatus DSM 436]
MTRSTTPAPAAARPAAVRSADVRPAAARFTAVAATAAATLAATLAPPAHAAGPLETLGAPTSANALTSRVLARGPEAAFFNPALLPDAPPTTEAGFFLLFTRGDINLGERPAGSDVPESIYDAQIRNSDGSTRRLDYRPMPTANLLNQRANTQDRDALAYASIGVIRRLYKQYLVLGFYALLPIRSFQEQRAFFVDERAQYFGNQLQFELMGDRMVNTTFALALASRITPWLSVGVGADVTIGTSAVTSVHMPDAGDQSQVLISPDIKVESTFAPHFAIEAKPRRWLRLTSTLHLPSSSTTTGENRIRFWNFSYPGEDPYIRQTYQTTLGYEPTRIGFGVALLGAPMALREVTPRPAQTEHSKPSASPRYATGPTGAHPERPTARPLPPGWEVGVRAVITQWAQYRDRQSERPLDPWANTLSAGVGGAVVLGRRRVAADLAYTPTPVPDQTGRTNYVDNAKVGASLSLETPVNLLGADFGLAAFLQGHVMVTREVQKSADARYPVIDEVPDNAIDRVSGMPIDGAAGLQTNNPGYPGFTSSGWFAGAGFALRLPQ